MKVLLALAVLVLGALFAAPAQARPTQVVQWTAVGDDSLAGTAVGYDVRWRYTAPPAPADRSNPAMNAWWDGANQATGEPAPAASGTVQSMTVAPVGGFNDGIAIYFVIQVRDEAGNLSGYSNVALAIHTFVDNVAPAAPRDLITR